MQGEWWVEQTWRNLVMAHWRADERILSQHIPRQLELDRFDGRPYVSVVAFSVDPFRLRGLPQIRGMRRFWQVNVRTYVRFGSRRGVFFLRLETNRPWAARLGKLAYALPFEPAFMAVVEEGERLALGLLSHDGRPTLALGFRRAGSRMPWYEPAAGSLEHWLLNRYALFAPLFGVVMETRLRHRPWIIQPAEAHIGAARLLEPYGCEDEPAFACSAEARTARIGLPRPASISPYSPDNCSLAR